MDFLAIKEKGRGFLQRYRYVVLILAVGLLLMTIPEKKETASSAEVPAVTQTTSLQEELASILSKIKGAGRVEVLLTEGTGTETLYQTDTDQSNDSFQEETVILSGEDRSEAGLIRQVIPPKYLGAIVVCQGGDNPGVKLAVLEAVMKATGLKSNQISVLKMK